MSRPVAKAFGIDRWGDLTSVDTQSLELGPSRPLEQLSVRVACRECNSGWMSDLEMGMVEVASWVEAGEEPLGAVGLRVLKRWLIKTQIVLGAIEGGSRRFGTSDNFSIIPHVTHGRMLYEDDDDVLDDAIFGFARRPSPPPNRFAYRIENPRSFHAGGRPLNPRGSSSSIVTLGCLEAWTVVPFLSPRVGVPAALHSLSADSTFVDLPMADGIGSLSDVLVDYGADDIVAVFDQIASGDYTP